MTTFAAILTLLPFAFAMGQGAAMQFPLAIAIVSELLVQLPLVLLVMPLLFHLLRGPSRRNPRVGPVLKSEDDFSRSGACDESYRTIRNDQGRLAPCIDGSFRRLNRVQQAAGVA